MNNNNRGAIVHIQRLEVGNPLNPTDKEQVMSGCEGTEKDVVELIVAGMVAAPELRSSILSAVELYLNLHEKLGEEGIEKLAKNSNRQKAENPFKNKK